MGFKRNYNYCNKMTKIAYKLFRQLKSGEITSLFINKTRKLPYGEWLDSENYPTSGFAEHPGWHCTAIPNAPHLKMKLKSGEVRVWKMVLMEDFTEFKRPENQGGLWFLTKRIVILNDEMRSAIEKQLKRDWEPIVSERVGMIIDTIK